MYSIELISKGEIYLGKTLESIFNQTYRDFEVICADSSGDKKVKDMISVYNCKSIELPPKTRALRARYEAHKAAKGDKCMILDSTRPLKVNALKTLNEKYAKHNMVIIKEDSLGNGFWVKQAKLLKQMDELETFRLKNETIAFLLPRLFESQILTYSFENILNIAGELFDKISYGEHHLIFEQARKMSEDVVLTEEPLIYHYEDETLSKIIQKYYWYGKSQRVLKNLNSDAKKISTHIRKNRNLALQIKVLPITLARGIPFAMGYLIGK